MSTREVAAIAIKLLAIWMLLEVLIFLPGFISLFVHMQEAASLPYQIGLVCTYLAVGLLLAFVLFKTSNSVLSSTPDAESNSGVSEGFILQVAGAFFVASAFEHLAGVWLTDFELSDNMFKAVLYNLVYALELVVGLALMTRREIFVKLLWKLRGRD